MFGFCCIKCENVKSCMWIIEKLSTFYLKYFCVGQSFKTFKKGKLFRGKARFFHNFAK